MSLLIKLALHKVKLNYLIEVQVMVLWVVRLCSELIDYRRFGGPCCLHLQGIPQYHYAASQPRRPRLGIRILFVSWGKVLNVLPLIANCSSIFASPWRWWQRDLPKSLHPTTSLLGGLCCLHLHLPSRCNSSILRNVGILPRHNPESSWKLPVSVPNTELIYSWKRPFASKFFTFNYEYRRVACKWNRLL